MTLLHSSVVLLAILQTIPESVAEVSPSALSEPVLEVGLVVEQVSKHGQAERVGLRKGDILLGWKRGNASGDFASPFDLTHVFLEQAGRGPVTLKVKRGAINYRLVFGSDTWGISGVRPNFNATLLSVYQEAEKLSADNKLVEAAERYRAAAAMAISVKSPVTAQWLLAHAGAIASAAQRWDLAEVLYQEAIDESADGGFLAAGEVLRRMASEFERRDDFANAAKYYRLVLAQWEKLGQDTMAVANVALPLGIAELNGGDFDRAEEDLSRSLAIGQKHAPNSIHALITVSNLAVLYHRQGRFDKAEEYYLKAVDSEEKLFPNTAHLASALSNLGDLFDQEGDFLRAELYEHKALRILERLGSKGPQVANILDFLSDCALETGHFAKAQMYEERALAIREKIGVKSLERALSLAGLGKIALRSRRLDAAKQYYRESLAIAEEIKAAAFHRVSMLVGLAAVFQEEGDFPAAEEHYRQALEIIETEDRGNIDKGDILGHLAETVYRQNRQDDAVQLYEQTLRVLESQLPHLGRVEETRSHYRAVHGHYYQEYADLLLEKGETNQAFELMERSRARTLFETLTLARVNAAERSNPSLRDREAKLRRLVNAKSEYRMQLTGGTHTEQELGKLNEEITDLLLRYQQVSAEIRASDPGYAALAEARQLTVDEIRQLLDVDTLVLEYWLGDTRSHLWAVSATSIAVYDLPGRTEIEKAARRVYTLLTRRNQPQKAQKALDGDEEEKELETATRHLSLMVLGPVKEMLGRRRLVFVADGALQYIPFSALPAPRGIQDLTPLVAKHEIVTLPSISVLAEIRRQEIGRRRPPGLVAILADPVFDRDDERVNPGTTHRSGVTSSAPSKLTRSATEVGLDVRAALARLIYSRQEADAVMKVIPAGKRLKATDFDANRALATSGLLAKFRIVHFATHGFLNNAHPELSGLVFTLVDQRGAPQNGFLTLQEIYNLQLPVDLVVLSACSTGLGEDIRGEGLISLTRGFMYAGASRVMASLWNVSDRATADLMAEFYQAMEQRGMSPAAALRAAQIKMSRSSRWHSPYYWAAFEIQGEWR
jgi:CHAT domain-containing protein/tetratricopeptide (TPR) repeat protein